jgi:thiamine biosynthesis lipoprotein
MSSFTRPLGRLAPLIAAWLLVARATNAESLDRFEATQPHMGTTVQIVVYAADEKLASRAIAAGFGEIRRLNRILSDYDPESEVSRLSRSAPTPKPIALGEDLWSVLSKSQQWSERTDGAFDVTVGPLTTLWRQARSDRRLPPEDQLAAARQAVGWRNLVLHEDQRTASLLKSGMRLDLGGLAKGFAADQALAAMKRLGVTSVMVKISGDITLGDPPPDADVWRIGVAPLEPKAAPSRFLKLKNCSVSTSGDAWQHVEIDGRRYSHILNPKTGLGLTSRRGVTVVAPQGIDADALATAVSVLGPAKGIELADTLPDMAALMREWPAVGGAPEIHASARWKRLEKGDSADTAPRE